MNVADLLIIFVALGAMARGIQIGFFRQALSILGFFAGLFLGSLIAPKIVNLSLDALTRALLTITLPLGLAFILGSVGEYIGMRLKRVLHKLRFNWLDMLAGGLCGSMAVLLIAWLLAAATTSVPVYGKALGQSRIIAVMNRGLPPAPGLISRLEKLLNPNGFPRVFVDGEPRTESGAPVSADVAVALAQAGDSTVKIEGLSCDVIAEGSGFVAKTGLVVTNAHVIAGVERPSVVNREGRRHRATTVWFDPDLDLAILQVEQLDARGLALNSATAGDGTAAVALGYPGGGGLVGEPAAVLQTLKALGRDIYNRRLVTREIYELHAQINPGNSGGPLVLADGSVIGLVFAKSVINDNIGYALTARQIEPAVSQVEKQSQAVSTGSCKG